jgi:hypothetical protein
VAETLPRNTPELLAVIEDEWLALLRVVDRLTPKQMITPDSGGWSPKDNLAHLAAWMNIMKDAYIHKMPVHEALGIDAEEHKKLDEDGENAVLFLRYRDLQPEVVLAMLKASYADVIDTLRAMPFDELMMPLRAGGLDKRLVIESVLGNTSDHFKEHRQTIERAS